MNPQQKEGNDGWKGRWEGRTINDGWKEGRMIAQGYNKLGLSHNPQSRAFDSTACFMHTAGYEIKLLHQNM